MHQVITIQVVNSATSELRENCKLTSSMGATLVGNLLLQKRHLQLITTTI